MANSYYVSIVILFALFWLIFFVALYGRTLDGSWSWRRAWCRICYGYCSFEWHHNDRETESRCERWVGVYRCTRCPNMWRGTARWLQHSRRLDETESA